MVKLSDTGAYLLNGTELIMDDGNAEATVKAKTGSAPDKSEAAKNTIAYGILTSHNTSGDDRKLSLISLLHMTLLL